MRKPQFVLKLAAIAMLTCVLQWGVPSAAADETYLTEAAPVIYERNGVQVFNGGYGSGMALHPTDSDVYYLLTDRGPNFDGMEGEKVFPVPSFVPQIGVFRLVEGTLVKESVIMIKDAEGNPITGLPNPVGEGGTGETPIDLDGNLLESDPEGLDSEGLVALADGTFWISDEYGPHILHIAADGTTIERINPFGTGTGGRALPKVFANRRANRGMEGLTITPDGTKLVGIMQSALDNPASEKATIRANSRATRIVVFDISTGETQQYIYLQDKPNLANSEIRAISDTEFVVLERDSAFPNDPEGAARYKLFYRIDISGATDVSDPENGDLGLTYDVDGEMKSIEQLTTRQLLDFGIVPVSKELFVDLQTELPTEYNHDKPEGFVLRDNTIAIINDDDFGIDSDGLGGIVQKILPGNGEIDRNILYVVDLPTEGSYTDAFTHTIQEIQGAGHTSPLVGETVLTTGIVTAIQNGGFYIQNVGDDDIATSDAVYVSFATDVLVGDEVEVYGQVAEVGFGSDLTTTQINAISYTLLSTGNDLPAAVVIGDGGRVPPAENIDDDGLTEFDAVNDGIDFYESLEAMLVQVNNAEVVGSNRFGEIALVSDGGANAEVRSNNGGIMLQPTDANPERIITDDAIVWSELDVTVGDYFLDPIVGVISYSFGNFKLLNVEPWPEVQSGGTEPAATGLVPSDSQLAVATFNVENLNPSEGDRFEELADIVVHHLFMPDIIGLQEIQDDTGFDDDGVVSANETFALMIEAIVDAGGPEYEFRQIDPNDKADGGAPGANIRVGFLFNPARVAFVDRGEAGADDATAVVAGTEGPELSLSPGRIDPNNAVWAEDDTSGFAGTRRSLAGEFVFKGETIFVVVNHFKSKSGDSALFGGIQPIEQPTLVQRVAQAELVNGFVSEILAADENANVIVLGDMNDFEFSDTLATLKGDNLTNLMDGIALEDRYTYIFDGNSQVLDHILVSDNLTARNHAVDAVHLNADFDTDVRASDHDPVVARFNFGFESEFVLQVLHSSDNESSFQDPNTGEPKILNYGAVVEGLRQLGVDEGIPTIYLTAGDHTLPGPFYQASEEIEEYGAKGLADIALFNSMGLTANGIGNHEFDGGINDFARMLNLADYPFISVNLDFSSVTLEDGTPAIELGVDGGSVEENAGKIVKSAYVEVDGEKIGLIGRSPADFFNVIADPESNLPGLDFVGGRDPETNQPLESAIPQVLEQVDLLKAQGINKIVLLDHAQDFTGDPLSAQSLRDIDIIVAAGSTGFMASDSPLGPFNKLRDEDASSAEYPTVRDDSEGNTVLVVNSEQLYRYVGNLIVGFDGEGHIDFVDVRSGPVATTTEAVDLLASAIGLDSLDASMEVLEIYDALLNTPLIQDQLGVIAMTEHPLNGLRADVRTRETNLGRLAADSTLWFAREYAEKQALGIEVDIALKNGGGIRDSILGPNISKFPISTALAFDNTLAIVQLTGAELLAAMENSISRNPSADGRFPQVAGIQMEFDNRRPGLQGMTVLTHASRISNLAITRANGEVVVLVKDFKVVGDLSQTFWMATNSFLLTGGDGYAALLAASEDTSRTVHTPPLGERQILSDYIVDALSGLVSISDDIAKPRVTHFNELTPNDSYDSGLGEAGAEIVTFDPASARLFVNNGANNAVDVIDASDPDNLTLAFSIENFEGTLNSVATANGILAVAMANSVGHENGWVILFNAETGGELARLEVGALPDMVTFTPDGTKVLVANEGEPNADYTIDPEGSVSIVDLGDATFETVAALTQEAVTTVSFAPYNFLGDVLKEVGVRIFGRINNPKTGEFLRESTLAEDLEPEYIAVSPGGALAFVGMQEANAMAVIDIESKLLIDLFPLGYKDHSIEGSGFDASDRDGGINIKPWPTLGMYQPDSIASYETLGGLYVVGANEGDSRDYDGFSEEVRVADLVLDPEAYPDAEMLQTSENLGRLKTTTATGDYDGDGDIDQIYSYGARSFSIWDEMGNLVFDSGDQFEQILAQMNPDNFNSADDENGTFDNRSDDKGPEPEALAIGQIGDRQYAFIGFEREGGIMMYDITYPYEPDFIRYINLRDFAADDIADAGDLSPEGFKFIPAADSPNGEALLAVANEISGTTRVIMVRVAPSTEFTLQVIHSSDNESAFQDPNTLEPTILNYGAVISGLKNLAAKEGIPSIYVTAGDHTLPKPYYEAAAEVPELGQPGLGDIAMFNAMGLTANGIGNHEFDGGINEFAHMLNFADYPFISANLDFSGVDLADGTPAIEVGIDGGSVAENAGKIVKSAYIEVGGEKIGLIGRAPADFFNVVEDPDNTLPGLDFIGGRDGDNQPLVSAVGQVLEQVELLEAQGVNKIVLMDHAQDFTGDPLHAQALRGIDIIVSAGATGFLANDVVDGPFNLLREGDAPTADYPAQQTDSEGHPVLIVNSDQLYRYVGNLIVTFDHEGHISDIDGRSGPIATSAAAIDEFEAYLDGPVVAASEEVRAIYQALRETDSILSLFEVIGETAQELVGVRAQVRTRETNLGRLAADSTLWYAQQYLDAQESGIMVDIALKNGGGIRDTILGPPVTRFLVNNALAFDNKLSIVEVTASELIATFENAVSRFPDADGRFPQVAGVFVEFDADMPGVQGEATLDTASRLRTLIVHRADGSEDVIVQDGIVQGDLARRFVLATNSFLLTGGDGYAGLLAASEDETRTVYTTDLGEQQIMVDYIATVLGGEIDLPEPVDTPRVVRYFPVFTYEAWSALYFVAGQANTGAGDDFDFDGIDNGTEYRYGLDPTVFDEIASPVSIRVEDETVLVTFTRSTNTGLIWVYETLSVLGNGNSWNALEEGTGYSVEVTEASSNTEIVTVTLLGEFADSLFVRIRSTE